MSNFFLHDFGFFVVLHRQVSPSQVIFRISFPTPSFWKIFALFFRRSLIPSPTIVFLWIRSHILLQLNADLLRPLATCCLAWPDQISIVTDHQKTSYVNAWVKLIWNTNWLCLWRRFFYLLKEFCVFPYVVLFLYLKTLQPIFVAISL